MMLGKNKMNRLTSLIYQFNSKDFLVQMLILMNEYEKNKSNQC
jgi:hypothetical protein